MSESRLSPTAYVLIGIAIGGLAGACAAGADQPNMQAALGSLQQARSYLVQSTPNKGGHRERAIQFRRPGDQPRPRPASPTPATEARRKLHRG